MDLTTILKQQINNLETVISIGVTGHRNFGNKKAIQESVQKVFKRLYGSLSEANNNRIITIRILSPLAEGADRIVAQEGLKNPSSILIVPLPFKKDEYLNDFQTDESKQEFESLIQKARETHVLPPTDSREDGYAQVGKYIVKHCDLLIAVWDGKPARGLGGTAETVQLARNEGLPVIWIHAENPQIVTEEP